MLGGKTLASDLINQAPDPPGIHFSLRNQLNKLKDRQEPTDDLSPPLSPPALPPGPGQGPGLPPSLPFIPPPPPSRGFF